MEDIIIIKKLDVNTKDINKVMIIWKEATIKAHRFIPDEYWLNNYDIVKDKYIPMGETYVYLEENEIKGFISIIEGYIGALFVDINSQGKGIGRSLIEHTKAIYENLILSVYKKNDQAVGFYKKVGFTVKSEKINEETNELEYNMNFEKQ